MATSQFPTALANGISGVFLDNGGMSWNVFSSRYAVKGDGIHDDSLGLLDSGMDAIANGGIWLLPRPPVSYLVGSPIQFAPNGGGSCLWGMCPGGGMSQINYVGPSGSSCLSFLGLSRSELRGIGITLGGTGKSNCVGFDWPGGQDAGFWRLDKCNVQIQAGGHHVGFRLGQSIVDGSSNLACTQFHHCMVTGANNTDGSIGYQIGGREALSTSFYECGGAQLSQLCLSGAVQGVLAKNCLTTDMTVTVFDAALFPKSGLIYFSDSGEIANYSSKNGNTLAGLIRGINGTTAAAHGAGVWLKQYVPNQGVYPGASDWNWLGGGGSNNLRDFAFLSAGRCTIKPSRMESGQQFFRRWVAGGDFGGSAANVLIESATLAQYTEPADGAGVIALSGNTQLVMTNNYLYGPVFGQGFLTNQGTSAMNGSVTIMGLTIPANGPPWTIGNGWPVTAMGVLLTSQYGRPQGTIHQLS